MNPSVDSARVLTVPVTRPPFNYQTAPNSQPASNGYYVNIQVSPHAPIPGTIHTCFVDTGSCGIVVPQAVLYPNGDVLGNPLPGVVQVGPATVPYKPSKDDLNGSYYQLAELAIGASDESRAFVGKNVQVIGVYGSSPGEGMMGVGFGRPCNLARTC